MSEVTSALTTVSARPPRPVDLVVISDVHLGTRDCKAEQLDAYLADLAPKELVLNGDIVDLREAWRGYWPASHSGVMRRLMDFAERGIPVHYVTGNHDEVLRRFSPFATGHFRLCDHVERDLDGRKTWIVHGDAIEHQVPIPRLVRKAGCVLYHAARRLERLSVRCGLGDPGLVKAMKSSERASAHIARYEDACVRAARLGGFDAIVTGHIHVPNLRSVAHADGGEVLYANSGDWVDSMSALEWHGGAWQLRRLADGDTLAAAADVEAPEHALA